MHGTGERGKEYYTYKMFCFSSTIFSRKSLLLLLLLRLLLLLLLLLLPLVIQPWVGLALLTEFPPLHSSLCTDSPISKRNSCHVLL